jgi:ubiquinone biosynthesis accessory factor UbiJ
VIDALQQQSLQATQQVIFFVTERLAHACLHLDPGTRARLNALSGKCLRFHITDSVPYYRDGIVVFVFPTAKGFELSADSRNVADAALALSAKDLLALLRNRPTAPGAVAIEGDQALLMAVLDIVNGFDIDWEKAMAPVTGDVIAHHVGKNVRATEKWLAASFAEARRLAQEYLEEELPVARQSKAFKPVFDNMDKMKSAGEAVRDKFAEAAAKSPFFRPGK